MRIARKTIGAGVATLFIASIAIQSLSTVQAEKFGYMQGDCPSIVQKAIDTVSRECTKAGRNKLCYGNSTIQAVFQADAGNVTFQSPGDTVDVAQIKQFTLGGMDTAADVWGVAEMKIQADLPDTDPTQNVTMILFGDVQLTDATSDANATAIAQTPTGPPSPTHMPTDTATSSPTVNRRQATQVAASATNLAAQIATATAKASTPTPTGTIPAARRTQAAATATRLANLIATNATATLAPTETPTALPTATAASGSIYGVMQAFYFQSKDSAPCDQAPHDGVLIQSPQGKQRVTLSIDGATISLGSTVFITAQPSKFLTINTLEGSAQVTAAGQTQTTAAGTAVQVPLDANLHASGPPAAPQFYTADATRALPIASLPTAITSAPGLPSGAAATAWTWTQYASTGDCNPLLFQTVSVPVTVITDIGNGRLWISPNELALVKSANGIYQATNVAPLVGGGTDTFTFSLQFVDTTHMTGQELFVAHSSQVGESCTETIPLSLVEASALPTASPSPSPATKP